MSIQAIREYYAKCIAKRLPAWCRMSWMSGSVAYGGGTIGKSDIDIVIVLDDLVYDLSQAELEAGIQPFLQDYLLLHRELDFRPDLVFPGEYITESLMLDAIAGRGFHVDSAKKLFLPKASTAYYLEDPERSFRAWLSQTAFSQFVCGDRNEFHARKAEAWLTILKFLLKDLALGIIRQKDVLSRLRAFGVHDDYWHFESAECGSIVCALQTLAAQGFLSEADGGFVLNPQPLVEWEDSLAARIRSGSIRRAQYIFDEGATSRLADYATREWEALVCR